MRNTISKQEIKNIFLRKLTEISLKEYDGEVNKEKMEEEVEIASIAYFKALNHWRK